MSIWASFILKDWTIQDIKEDEVNEVKFKPLFLMWFDGI